MMALKSNIFRLITALIFILISVLSLLIIVITYFSTTRFHQASTQLLNKDVAAHIAKFSSPFDKYGLNKKKADSVFHRAMIISPNAEIYFLDTEGKIIAFHAQKTDIKLWKLPLNNIKTLIASQGKDYIKGPDPRDPDNPKIFSAAEVKQGNQELGYIYVIFGSMEYRNVTSLLFGSHISGLAIQVFSIVIAISIIISVAYVNRLRKNFKKVIHIMGRFQKGDFNARFDAREYPELLPVTQSFNQMADQLAYNINLLKKSQKERNDFITNISHDLRNPLSIARGYIETLLIKNTPEISKEDLEEYMPIVINKIQQVENMVKQLLDLSKMESVEFKAKKEPFVLSEIVQETVNTFQLMASDKQVKLECTQCQFHVWTEADIGLMERVIQNLVENAVKATPPKGKIHISLALEHNELIFNIENSGKPLHEDLLQWINNYKEESGIYNRPAKLGLGLVIVQKILHLHNYPFQAKSPFGLGIHFSFRMPVFLPKASDLVE
ncbi:MAG: HAMP domain-containing histidine kinase [Bacteroidota bacterium]|jgi:signal transduction histidine kinase|nr:HAMP domain-containing histidine kinase [Bacteroidota bacterium]